MTVAGSCAVAGCLACSTLRAFIDESVAGARPAGPAGRSARTSARRAASGARARRSGRARSDRDLSAKRDATHARAREVCAEGHPLSSRVRGVAAHRATAGSKRTPPLRRKVISADAGRRHLRWVLVSRTVVDGERGVFRRVAIQGERKPTGPGQRERPAALSLFELHANARHATEEITENTRLFIPCRRLRDCGCTHGFGRGSSSERALRSMLSVAPRNPANNCGNHVGATYRSTLLALKGPSREVPVRRSPLGLRARLRERVLPEALLQEVGVERLPDEESSPART